MDHRSVTTFFEFTVSVFFLIPYIGYVNPNTKQIPDKRYDVYNIMYDKIIPLNKIYYFVYRRCGLLQNTENRYPFQPQGRSKTFTSMRP